MNKIKIIYFTLIPIILSCVSNSVNSELPYILERMHTDTTYKVSIGDCFEFKENKIPIFGFVLTEITGDRESLTTSMLHIKTITAANTILQ